MNTKPISVLLIEDNPGDARLILELLQRAAPAQFELVHVERLAVGLRHLVEETFDVLLLDLGLADSQGLDTLAKIHTQVPHVPTVLLTGLDDEAVALEAVRKGAQDYLIKGQVDGNLLPRAICYAIERHRAEAALRKRNRELALLNRLGRELSATIDFHHLIEQLLNAAMATISADGASVWLWDDDQEDSLVCQAIFPLDQEHSPLGLRLPGGEGIAGWVAQQGASAIVLNVGDDPRFFSGSDAQTGFRTFSALAVPLRARDKVIGVLEIVNKRDGDFDEDDRVLLETLAVSAATAIENARLVEALRHNAAELEARNQELDAFAHTVAHDLKSPLANMVSFCEAMTDYVVAPEGELTLYLNLIGRNGRKLSNIVDELLLLASVHRMPEVALKPLDMAGIVAEARQRLVHMTEEYGAEIISCDEWPAAVGYGPWVEEVWVNYLSNAIKYGGQPPCIQFGATIQSDGKVRFWLRDNGRGLTPEEQDRLFTPFERLDRVRAKGHGLGLSIVRHIVEKLGGQVTVESQIGHGSVFGFTLPGAE